MVSVVVYNILWAKSRRLRVKYTVFCCTAEFRCKYVNLNIVKYCPKIIFFNFLLKEFARSSHPEFRWTPRCLALIQAIHKIPFLPHCKYSNFPLQARRIKLFKEITAAYYQNRAKRMRCTMKCRYSRVHKMENMWLFCPQIIISL